MEMMDGYIDLHLHLDGAITLQIARKLAKIQNITLPSEDNELISQLRVPADCKDLNDFLRCFALPVKLTQTREGIATAFLEVRKEAYEQGVEYAEIRFAPQLHKQKGLGQREVIETALGAIAKSPYKTNLILCLMRGADNRKDNEETVELAKEYLVEDGGVVAIDLAGAEALFPTSDYENLFLQAKEAGIPFTVHAGEAAGAESVRCALNYGACRIGHGVRIFEDSELMEEIRKQKITLEMCPTSNRITHAVEDMNQYPLLRYLREGIRVTVNTDDPAICGTTLGEEYAWLKDKQGMTEEERRHTIAYAIDAAFTSQKIKEELRRKLL